MHIRIIRFLVLLNSRGSKPNIMRRITIRRSYGHMSSHCRKNMTPSTLYNRPEDIYLQPLTAGAGWGQGYDFSVTCGYTYRVKENRIEKRKIIEG